MYIRALRNCILLLLLVGTTVAGCGRREKPSWFDAQPPPINAAATAKPLPPSAFQVRWGTLAFPRTVEADRMVPLTVSFTNASDVPWPDKATASPQLKDGSYAVRLTHNWVRVGTPGNERQGADRTDLTRPVMPGDTVDLGLMIRTPVEPGDYRLLIELVQELVGFFADRGAERITLPVRVVAAGQAPADTKTAQPGQPPKAAAR